jgi:RNA recognition motif-containing protein
VLEEANGRSKGCGLVEFSTQEEADKAIAELNNTELEGRLIFVREDREPEGGSISKFAKRAAAPRGGGEGRQLYVGNVSLAAPWQYVGVRANSARFCDVERRSCRGIPTGSN